MVAGGLDCALPSDGRMYPGTQIRALHIELNLFALPPSLGRINRLLSSAPVDLKCLGEAVKEEPHLVPEALKLCNSSLFGLSHPVASLEQAVIIMDSDVVRTLLVACWLIQFTRANLPARENLAFWRHSLLVAQLSRRLGEWTSYAQPEWVFLAGLFHDLGILPFLAMLSRTISSEPGGVFENVGESIESQRRRFATDHCEMGLLLGTDLGLPLPLIEVCARHHQRGAVLSHTPLSSLASAAEMIAQAAAPGGASQSSVGPAQTIRDALSEYLPGFSRLANSGLAASLESDLRGGSTEHRDSPESIWEEHVSGLKVPARAGDPAWREMSGD
jgi:HD-like signal output (HDOD) protein